MLRTGGYRRPVNEAPEDSASTGLWGVLKRHPIITGTLVVCSMVGAILGFTLLTGDWSPLRRILAGAVAGAGTGFLITATKMIG